MCCNWLNKIDVWTRSWWKMRAVAWHCVPNAGLGKGQRGLETKQRTWNLWGSKRSHGEPGTSPTTAVSEASLSVPRAFWVKVYTEGNRPRSKTHLWVCICSLLSVPKAKSGAWDTTGRNFVPTEARESQFGERWFNIWLHSVHVYGHP